MTVDPDGRSFVADGDGRVLRLEDDNFVRPQVFDVRDARSRAQQQQYAIVFIAFAPDGDLLVADELAGAVWRVRASRARLLLGNGSCMSSPDGTAVQVAGVASMWGVTATPDYRMIFSESEGSLRWVRLGT